MNMQSHRKKLLLGFICFALIMACVPSVATPVAPLDANAINTIIMQTAENASMQTAAAAPILTSTNTFTVTPPSTFTLESTFTPVGTIIFSTPTPIAREQYFRVKHDSQLERYNYKSRTAAPDWSYAGAQTPEVFRMFVALSLGSGTHRTKVDGNWGIYIDALNDHNARKLKYLKANNSGLFNGAGFPQLESLTMGGNVIALVEIQNGWGRVRTLDYINPGTLKEMNYLTRPDLIHKFVVVGWSRENKSTYWVNPPPGDIYWPLVSSRTVWMPLEVLEPFPQLPMTVTAKTTLDIRTKPARSSSLNGRKVPEGETTRVVEYYLSASDVWGRLADGGWISLLIYEKGAPQYPTSWEMETRPPPPP